MPSKPIHNGLFPVNFITGISDGLILPFVAGMIAYPHFADTPWKVIGVGITVAFVGAIAYGFARFFGEREEIRHNHPVMALDDVDKEIELMNTIGIDKNLTLDMQAQMEQERALWLREVEEHELGWEQYDEIRALKSGLHTAAGFITGGLLVTLPFYWISLDIRSLVVPCGIYLALFACFGWMKGSLISSNPFQYALLKCARGLVLLILVLAVTVFISVRNEQIVYHNSQIMTDAP